MQERRRYVRLNIPLEVNYTIHGKGDTKHKAITKNISPNGARFAVEQQLPAGAILNLHIRIPTKAEPVSIQAKAVWSKELGERGKGLYDSGFEFIQIPEESKREFFQYLCNLMYDQLKSLD